MAGCGIIPAQTTDTFTTFGARDLKVAPMTATSETEWIECHGVNSISFSPEILTQNLTSNDIITDVWTQLQGMNVEFENMQVPFEALNVMIKSDFFPSSTTAPVQNAEIVMGQGCTNPYFKLQAQIMGINGGSLIIRLGKVQLNQFMSMDFAQGAFATLSCGGIAIGDTDGNIIDILYEQTATALPNLDPIPQ